MNFSILKQKKFLYISIVVLISLSVTALILVLSNDKSNSATKSEKNDEENYSFYHGLKINGEYVSVGIFRREEKAFFDKYKTNSEYLRMSYEERDSAFIDQVIERIVLEDYVLKNARIKVTSEDIEKYINDNVISNLSDENLLDQYLAENGFSSKKDLESEVKFYLLKMDCLPDIAREKGIKLDKNDEKRIEEAEDKKKMEDKLVVDKFLSSDEIKEWIDKLKKDVKIEIFAPSILAYRNYKDGNYEKAAKYYKKAYIKYDKKEFLEKSEECEDKIKNN
ncbi:MAG: hypothetical protein ABF289_14450 [Clostridiales bacterium]